MGRYCVPLIAAHTSHWRSWRTVYTSETCCFAAQQAMALWATGTCTASRIRISTVETRDGFFRDDSLCHQRISTVETRAPRRSTRSTRHCAPRSGAHQPLAVVANGLTARLAVAVAKGRRSSAPGLLAVVSGCRRGCYLLSSVVAAADAICCHERLPSLSRVVAVTVTTRNGHGLMTSVDIVGCC